MKIIDKLIRLEKEANEFGFNWQKAEQIMAQIQSECQEIEIHLNDNHKEKLQEELGDLLHAVFSLCIFCQLDPLETVEKSVDKFEKRFNRVKELAKNQGLTSLKGYSFDDLMHFWNQAKQIEK